MIFPSVPFKYASLSLLVNSLLFSLFRLGRIFTSRLFHPITPNGDANDRYRIYETIALWRGKVLLLRWLNFGKCYELSLG